MNTKLITLVVVVVAIMLGVYLMYVRCPCGEKMMNSHRCIHMEQFADINYSDINTISLVQKYEKAFLPPTSILQSSLGATVEKFIFKNIQDRTVFRLKVDTELQNIIPPQAYTVYLVNGTDRKMIGQLKQDGDSRYKMMYESEDLSLYNFKSVVITLTVGSRTEDVLKGDF